MLKIYLNLLTLPLSEKVKLSTAILKGNGMSPEVKFYLNLVLDEFSFGTLVDLILLALLQALNSLYCRNEHRHL